MSSATALADAPAAARARKGLSYSSDEIKQMLPHRWPMLMIDRAYDVVPGVSGRGIKSVSVNEPFFAGHYPDHSIMPGVMIVESMAQLVAVVYVAEILESATGATEDDASRSVGYLGSISQMKFSRLVVPGDQLTLEARLGQRLGGLRQVKVRASVGSELAAAGTLVVTTGRKG
ncbi:3-hydroxyacyl-ACP dehydratase FabZ [Streptomyces sp. NE06-03E]|uniref:3-hydroxyacyl-[acyl-carrier-protein] dehydratase n=2 Tax=Streptomyces TaxID=1883 RepID=A0A652LB88_9ACTN|nr:MULTISPECIES: 3-hydroxyacyl-ACP dehydratase FabZ [unclassified Streptomyces]WSS63154.1 3-hydroxyacyl-ACP dehydratase FabZ [Streptomyces sp. NBC_01177]WSS70168.1 3-hydroxyacyl-ACP dehydratase FabZ [Streptomyces sp. NBC_01175]WSS77168.1 3-hydroxyacyl-ACP dehydratase FabZ [Streptomyces sp. NBC_01174]MDX3056881.1 3-hydroxyacyl-ACP dehydratase FabZ [Streptomyces sp. NE06-03E]MDX3327286.1 3-hydroxyacyl-ACP dehydratase FabZ [Streptomyces sp. ME02-6979-3A]